MQKGVFGKKMSLDIILVSRTQNYVVASGRVVTFCSYVSLILVKDDRGLKCQLSFSSHEGLLQLDLGNLVKQNFLNQENNSGDGKDFAGYMKTTLETNLVSDI